MFRPFRYLGSEEWGLIIIQYWDGGVPSSSITMSFEYSAVTVLREGWHLFY